MLDQVVEAADPLGSDNPVANNRSLVPSTNARAPENTGCRCMGFHNGRASMSASASVSRRSSAVKPASSKTFLL